MNNNALDPRHPLRYTIFFEGTASSRQLRSLSSRAMIRISICDNGTNEILWCVFDSRTTVVAHTQNEGTRLLERFGVARSNSPPCGDGLFCW
jgi:hypothetical protein